MDSTPREPLRNDLTDNHGERQSSVPNDLPDSPRDRERLQNEEVIIDLPDVKDIPGQEFVHAPPLGLLADTTVSSADEEGAGLLDDDDEDADYVMGTDADVPEDERRTLARATYRPGSDDERLQRASMDNTDFGGERLNEKGFGESRSGTDLDVPGAEQDDIAEDAGTEDEENNNYSLGSADNDNVTEGTP